MPTAPFPPAPWEMVGVGWAGLFCTNAPVPLPAGRRRLLPPRLAVVALLRYRAGTLAYDELIVGVLARRGLRPGLVVTHIWVDSVASLHGGRQIWGLPKQLATFTWHGDTVEACDADGRIAAITAGSPLPALPPLPLVVPALGRHDDGDVSFVPRLWACLTWPAFQIDSWSPRFLFRPAARPIVALGARPFRATFPPPTPLLG